MPYYRHADGVTDWRCLRCLRRIDPALREHLESGSDLHRIDLPGGVAYGWAALRRDPVETSRHAVAAAG